MSQSIPSAKTALVAVAAALGGMIIGWLIGQSVAWSAVGAVVGAGIAAMILFVGVRPIVAVPVGIGAGIGAYVGGTIVGVICDPKGCAAIEATAATVTGLGALVGIGLVVALATRSFEEYHAAVERGADPPLTACSPDEPEPAD
jgi:hypothetical protein